MDSGKDGATDPRAGPAVDPNEPVARKNDGRTFWRVVRYVVAVYVIVTGWLIWNLEDRQRARIGDPQRARCAALASRYDADADCSDAGASASLLRLERLDREARSARWQRGRCRSLAVRQDADADCSAAGVAASLRRLDRLERCRNLAVRHDADADCSDDGVAASLRRLESADREARREERARSQQRAREIAVNRCLVLSAQHDHAADCSESAAPDTVRRLERLAAREERARAEALAALSPADREWRRRLLADRAETASITVGGLCAPAIEAAAQFGFEWTDGWLGAKFDRWRLRPNAGEVGSADYLGDSARFQNAFGAWQPAVYSCSVDLSSSTPDDRRVTAVSIRRGRLPR